VQALNKFQSEIGGPLSGGDPGRRLIEPQPGESFTYFAGIPPQRQPQPGVWQFVALHRIFGSEELSLLSPGVAERVPQPHLALHPKDAAGLGIGEGEPVTVTIGRASFELSVKLHPGLPRSVAGLPSGLPRLPVLGLPAFGTIVAGKEHE
jgi:NADH-quinone oxidoreductase subunit G